MALTNLKPVQTEKYSGGLLLSIVIPTLDEFENLQVLLPQLVNEINQNETIKYSYEIIVVDDETRPETVQLIDRLKQSYNIKILPNDRKRGLAASAMEGFIASQGAIVLLMDGDGSHDPKHLTKMLNPILEGDATITVGSRYIKEGIIEKWPLKRHLISKICAILSRPLTGINDSGSGFFAFKKNCIDFAKVKPKSWKIGMEIFTKFPNKLREVPIVFVDRKFGESKFSIETGLIFSRHLAGLYLFKLFNRNK